MVMRLSLSVVREWFGYRVGGGEYCSNSGLK